MKNKPIRVQRKRTKGFKLPANTVCVDRTSKWGNPFRVVKEGGEFVTYLNDFPYKRYDNKAKATACCIEKFKDYLAIQILSRRLDITELAGKNLACFCALDQPCHADVLLELANS